MVLITAIIAAIALIISYVAWSAFYNLYLSPLKDIPGDKLAAVSRFYEFYWDCIQPGLYWRQIQRMHAEHGHIVRIGPSEVHITDPEYFDTLYNNSLKLDKDPYFYSIVGLNETAFSTEIDAIHRLRRSKVNQFFSKASVDRGEPQRQRVLNNMFAAFDKKLAAGEPVSMRYALRSFASDVVCDFCFPESMDYVSKDDFSLAFHKGQEGFAMFLPWCRHIPGLAAVMMSTPDFMLPYLPPETQAAMGFLKYVEKEVSEIVAGKDLGPNGKPEKPTVIRELLESDLPQKYRSPWALFQEGQVYVAAGTQTVARAIEETVFYILSTPGVAQKLTEEVRGLDVPLSANVSGKVLEQLPYLNAVVLETLRIAPAVPSRFPRINKTSPMKYGDYDLPPGTIIGMAPYDILGDESVFPEPKAFKPERWLDPTSKNKLMKYMVAFGKGSRNCIGQNLATSELFLVMGNLFRKYDLELYQTGVEEVTIVRDNFMPLHYKGSKGVRVMLSKPQK